MKTQLLKLYVNLRTNTLAILGTADTHAVEFFLACMSFSWGVWFFTHSNLFNKVPDYQIMGWISPHEWVWGVMFATAGTLRMLGLVASLTKLRKLVAFSCVMIWMFIAIATWLSAPGIAATATSFVAVLASTWVYWRLP